MYVAPTFFRTMMLARFTAPNFARVRLPVVRYLRRIMRKPNTIGRSQVGRSRDPDVSWLALSYYRTVQYDGIY
jgi:hypothetical protein